MYKQQTLAFVSELISIENGHEWVNLGLPSGTKWATCNVGATKPEEYGNYYAWGETEPKSTYDWNTYKWATAAYEEKKGRWMLETLTKYNTSSKYGTIDGKINRNKEDDAARANWGGKWRMPSTDEWLELYLECRWTWTDNYNSAGVAGQIVESKINGNAIFLPAAGYREFDKLYDIGISGIYWSCSIHTNFPCYAWNVDFFLDNVSKISNFRCCGQSVRPVLYMP